MAKFLNTSATTYYLEELIKNARERLILISPYLKLNERMKELLEDKNRLKIDVRIVYGKTELQPTEVNWLKTLTYIRTSYCSNLHAKCYLNEESCIITSLNLYEFSQVNNNEMGILLEREKDNSVYDDAFQEAQRIIRISDEVKISLDVISKEPEISAAEKEAQYAFLSTSRLASTLNMEADKLNKILCQKGWQELNGKKYFLTDAGKHIGGKLNQGKYGWYILWPADINLN